MTAMPSLSGHSGCRLQLREAQVLRKASCSPEYAPRLRSQIQKQRAMKDRMHIPGVYIPGILAEGTDGQGCYWADMELYIAKNANAFLSTCSPAGIERLAGTLIATVEAMESASEQRSIPGSLLLRKAEDVAASLEIRGTDLLRRRLLPDAERVGGYLRFLEDLLPESLELLVGCSHGDLSLTNLLIRDDGSELALVDFLDGFLEAPLIDMVKLRQDTCLGWAVIQHPPGPDTTRLHMALRHLDGLLVEAFETRQAYREHYLAFQFLNHLRILPYLRDPDTSKHVLGVLDTLMAPQRVPRRTP